MSSHRRRDPRIKEKERILKLLIAPVGVLLGVIAPKKKRRKRK